LQGGGGIPFDTSLQHEYSAFEDYALSTTIYNADGLPLSNPVVPYPSWGFGDSSFDQSLSFTATVQESGNSPGSNPANSLSGITTDLGETGLDGYLSASSSIYPAADVGGLTNFHDASVSPASLVDHLGFIDSPKSEPGSNIHQSLALQQKYVDLQEMPPRTSSRSPKRRGKATSEHRSSGPSRVSKTRSRPREKALIRSKTPPIPCVSCSILHKRVREPLSQTTNLFDMIQCERSPDAPDDECVRCQNRKYSFSNLPCLYFQVTEITLFRTITDPIANKPYKELAMRTNVDVFGICSLPSDSISRTAVFEITQNLGSVLRLTATRFDVTKVSDFQFKLMKGLHTHPFRLKDVDVARQEIKAFIVNSMPTYVDTKLQLGCDDGFSRTIFMAARQRAEHGDKHVWTPSLIF
jgi:hypothetical protein